MERVEILYGEARFFHKTIEGPQHASEMLICKAEVSPISHICL
jgi:hypothetical protein